jgi:CRP-like cAMP-binding protein
MEDCLPELERIPLFENIGPDELPRMLRCLGAVRKRFRRSEFISLGGDRLDQAGVLLRGAVHMIQEDARGNKVLLDSVGEGDLFGENFICAEESGSSVSFQAASDCVVLFLPLRRVLRTCSNACGFHHRLIENLAKIMARKNRLLLERLEILSRRTIRERLLTWFSQQTRKGGGRFTCPMGRIETAEYLCVDRSALTRELARMKREGLVDFSGNTYWVPRCPCEGAARKPE